MNYLSEKNNELFFFNEFYYIYAVLYNTEIDNKII